MDEVTFKTIRRLKSIFPITFQYLIIMDIVEGVSKETDSEMESCMQKRYL